MRTNHETAYALYMSTNGFRDRIVRTPQLWQDIADDAEKAIERIQQLGVRIHGSSRFTQYRKILRAVQQHEASAVQSARDFSLAHQAVSEIGELSSILDSIEEMHEPDPWIAKLATAVNGPVLIEDECRSSIARDTQFELSIASRAVSGGLDVQLGEPDILIGTSTFQTGIAAKRVTSRAQLRKRIREAARQVGASGKPGFICLDLSLIAHPREGFLQVDSSTIAAMKVRLAADSLCSQCRSELRSMHERTKQSIIAVLVYVLCIYRRSDSTGFGSVTRWSFGSMLADDDPRSELLAQLYRGLEKGLAF
ncbi:hypothetical protein ACFLSG_03565 [Candidatus Bipolaricaulota bacterium]